MEVFTKGNRLYPHSVRMLIGLGAAWFARGSYDQAVMRVCEASDLNPSDPIPYLFIGKMQSAESAPSEKIVEKLHRFVAQQPDNAEANYYYAVGLWKMRKVSADTAARTADRVAAATMPFVSIRILPLPTSNWELFMPTRKIMPKAISEYQQAIQVDPKMEEAHYRLAQAYRQTGDAAKAEAELRVYEQIAKELAQETNESAMKSEAICLRPARPAASSSPLVRLGLKRRVGLVPHSPPAPRLWYTF